MGETLLQYKVRDEMHRWVGGYHTQKVNQHTWIQSMPLEQNVADERPHDPHTRIYCLKEDNLLPPALPVLVKVRRQTPVAAAGQRTAARSAAVAGLPPSSYGLWADEEEMSGGATEVFVFAAAGAKRRRG